MPPALSRREPCVSCGQPVFLAQRLVVEGHLYHRTCFVCTRCGTQLTLASYHHRDTDPDRHFCCEICPDEETDSQGEETKSEDARSMVLDGTSCENLFTKDGMQGLSDEEKMHAKQKIPSTSPALSQFLNSQFDDGVKQVVGADHLSECVSSFGVGSETDDRSNMAGNRDECVESVEEISHSDSNQFSCSGGTNGYNNIILTNKQPTPPVPIERKIKNYNSEESPAPAPSDNNNVYSVENIIICRVDSDSDGVNQTASATATNDSHCEFKSNDEDLMITKEQTEAVQKATYEEHTECINPPLVKSAGQTYQEGKMGEYQDNLEVDHNYQATESCDEVCVVRAGTDSIMECLESKANVPSLDEDKEISIEKLGLDDSAQTQEILCMNGVEGEQQDIHLRNSDEPEQVNTIDTSQGKANGGQKLSASSEEAIHFRDVVDVHVEHCGETEASSPRDKDVNYPEELNPFCSDDENENENTSKISTNPFGSCSEDEEEAPRVDNRQKPPRPPPPAIVLQAIHNKNITLFDQRKKIIPAPSLNPFGSDDEDEDMLESTATSVASSRLSETGQQSFHGSSTSLAGTQRRKKLPAPKPPVQQPSGALLQDETTSINSFILPANSSSTPHVSPRSKKRRPAPLPPTILSPLSLSSSQHHSLATSSPFVGDTSHQEHSRNSSMSSQKKVISAAEFDEQDLETNSSGDWGTVHGDSNRLMEPSVDSVSSASSEPASSTKSISRRRHLKGPAPGIPQIGLRGPMSMGALRRELALLEEQQRGLERQGVRLETLIRERTEGKDSPEGTTDVETDHLLLQLFDLVNEKNELFRRQAELMYMRKQQRLEEEQADLEQQVRVLMCVEESNKTDADKEREEALLARLVDVVQRRDLVVAALDHERIREKAEDDAIRERMTIHRAQLEEMSSSSTCVQLEKKSKKKRYWTKKEKVKKARDAETPSAGCNNGSATNKTKHKWFK